MSEAFGKPPVRDVRMMVAAVLRVTFSLMMWTLGGAAMTFGGEPAQEHRVVYTFAVNREHTENLQRWVNAGHDAWCRDAQLVAVAYLRRVSEELEKVETASLPVETERREKAETVYAFHSMDGLKSYRITLRRYEWLLPTAGSLRRMIWVPEKVEIVTRTFAD